LETWYLWWAGLSVAAVLNAAIWLLSGHLLVRRKARFPEEIYATRRKLFWLAGFYVAGCAFRSFFPMVDVPRLCLSDEWIGRIVFGRTVATVAELAFAAQWALLLREAGAVRAARAVVPLIGAAEVLSWLAVLTTDELFHAAENAVWPITVMLAVFFLATRWPHEGPRAKRAILAATGAAVTYVAFMVAYVVPMYLGRWQPGQDYLSLGGGLAEVLQRCRVSHDWELWWQDAIWLTPYFTLCVWMSVAFAHAPDLTNRK
jgi:hypothetical protein